MTRASAWQVYRELLAVIQEHAAMPGLLAAIATDPTNDAADDQIPDDPSLLPNQQDLPSHDSDEYYYMGGVGGGMGLQDEHIGLLDNLVDEDEPSVDDIDDIDAPAALLITAFSDEEEDVDDNIDEEA
ncbi:hypothetical protein EV363DRAFT_1296110 [Boletus edulis]|nr:hypothetical protein EV363DRAFT_1296110 [Boletus edulis]